MASPFLRAAQTAIKVAKKIGATMDVTLHRTTTEYDAPTGVASVVPTDYLWTVVVTEYADALVNGATIVAGDRKVLGAAADLEVVPDPETDTLIIDGLTYTIVQRTPDPANATHTLQVRR